MRRTRQTKASFIARLLPSRIIGETRVRFLADEADANARPIFLVAPLDRGAVDLFLDVERQEILLNDRAILAETVAEPREGAAGGS